MTSRAFEIWLAMHGMKQYQIADKFGITPNTITGYKRAGRFPLWFPLALKSLEGIGS